MAEKVNPLLTAVDSAVMVLDSAKGIETQTKKLFEVWRVCQFHHIRIGQQKC